MPETRHDPQAHGAKPSIGRVVHYVLPEQAGGAHRPAVIVDVHEGSENGSVQLQVFLDTDESGRFNDRPAEWAPGLGFGDGKGPILWATSIGFDAEKAPGTWHWPERE